MASDRVGRRRPSVGGGRDERGRRRVGPRLEYSDRIPAAHRRALHVVRCCEGRTFLPCGPCPSVAVDVVQGNDVADGFREVVDESLATGRLDQVVVVLSRRHRDRAFGRTLRHIVAVVSSAERAFPVVLPVL